MLILHRSAEKYMSLCQPSILNCHHITLGNWLPCGTMSRMNDLSISDESDGKMPEDTATTQQQQQQQQQQQCENTKNKVLACTLLRNQNELIVLRENDNHKLFVARFCGDTYKSLAQSDVVGRKGLYQSVITHPTDDNIVVVGTSDNVVFVNSTTLQTFGKIEGTYTMDVTMCADGTKCAVSDFDSNKCVVYDIIDLTYIISIATFIVSKVLSSDINNDGSKVACAGYYGVKLYDVHDATQPPITLRREYTRFVRFVNESQGLLYTNVTDVYLIDMCGVELRSFSGEHYPCSLTLINNYKWFVTGNKDNSINIHEVETGKTIYKFYHPSSDAFESSFAYHSNTKKLIGCTKSGKLFVLTH